MSKTPEILITPSDVEKSLKKKDGDQLFKMGESFQALMGEDDDSMALVFQKISPVEEDGEYTCVARTTRGLLTFGAIVHGSLKDGEEELNVRSPSPTRAGFPHWKPQLIVEKTEVVAKEGDQAMLQVQIKGYPKPDIRCIRENIPIKPSKKYKVFHEDEEKLLMLVIKDVSFDDAGIYNIQAENEIGFDSVDILLTVVRHKYPEINTDLGDITTSVNQTIAIPMEFDGIPKPKVQFYKEGREIQQSEHYQIIENCNSATLVIVKTTLEDTGVYSVAVTNELAQVSRYWGIYIYSSPTFIQKLGSSFDVFQKHRFFLKAKVQAEPKPEIQWYKDDKKLADDGRIIIDEDKGFYVLQVKDIRVRDAGLYTFLAINTHGYCEDAIRIFVKKAPEILEAFGDMIVIEQDIYHYVHVVTLAIRLEVYPRPFVKWCLDDVEIKENGQGYVRVQTDDEIMLVIDDVTTDHSGIYTCSISNECGHVEHYAKLIVNCSPKIFEELTDVTVTEKQTLQLSVKVRGYPAPTFKWFRNGKELFAGERNQIGLETSGKHRYTIHLTIPEIDYYEERGEYEIIITNSLGSSRSKCCVTVLTFPVILESNMKCLTVKEQSDVTYMVRGFANPPPVATWTWEGLNIDCDGHTKIITSQKGEDFRLGLRKLTPIDTGIYRCTLSNVVGKIEDRCILEVKRERKLEN